MDDREKNKKARLEALRQISQGSVIDRVNNILNEIQKESEKISIDDISNSISKSVNNKINKNIHNINKVVSIQGFNENNESNIDEDLKEMRIKYKDKILKDEKILEDLKKEYNLILDDLLKGKSQYYFYKNFGINPFTVSRLINDRDSIGIVSLNKIIKKIIGN